jgi:hypothetical protein
MGTVGSTGADVSLSDNTTTRAITWLTAWDSQGTHRTATVGDQAGADWLIREAGGLGAAPEVETFALDRLDPIDAYVEFGSTRIPGVPVFDAPATGADGVAGTLGPIEAEPGIAVAELPPRSVYTPDYEKLRRHAGHHGLVIVCEGAQPGLGLLNAERFRDPYGAPAIHVSSEASDTVLAASARQVSARLVTATSRTPAQASRKRPSTGPQATGSSIRSSPSGLWRARQELPRFRPLLAVLQRMTVAFQAVRCARKHWRLAVPKGCRYRAQSFAPSPRTR